MSTIRQQVTNLYFFVLEALQHTCFAVKHDSRTFEVMPLFSAYFGNCTFWCQISVDDFQVGFWFARRFDWEYDVLMKVF